MTRNDARQSKDIPNTLQFFSVSEVAAITDVSVKLVHEWIRDGLLPVFRVGPANRLIRVRRQDLEQLIETHVRSGKPGDRHHIQES